MKNISVFCASSSKVAPKFLETASLTGKLLSQQGKTIVYGGGSVGLMGYLADAALKNNAEIIGIIPKFMMEMEWGNPNISELIVVEDMFERKRLLLEKADAIIVLPGGCGTLDEMFEAITHIQLCRKKIPFIIVNTEGFYDPLISMLDKMISLKFMRAEHSKIWSIVNNPEEICDVLKKCDEGFTLSDAQL